MTLIARPRRFGKPLNMSMLEKVFVEYAGRGDLFEGLAVCSEERGSLAVMGGMAARKSARAYAIELLQHLHKSFDAVRFGCKFVVFL